MSFGDKCLRGNLRQSESLRCACFGPEPAQLYIWPSQLVVWFTPAEVIVSEHGTVGAASEEWKDVLYESCCYPGSSIRRGTDPVNSARGQVHSSGDFLRRLFSGCVSYFQEGEDSDLCGDCLAHVTFQAARLKTKPESHHCLPRT